MTSANMKFVALKVPPSGEPEGPKQKLDPGEHIVRRVVELGKLKAELDGAFCLSPPPFFLVPTLRRLFNRVCFPWVRS